PHACGLIEFGRCAAPRGGAIRALGRPGGAHGTLLRQSRNPASPRGRNSVTRTNSSPSANSQYSGNALVNQLLPRLTAAAPNTGPTSVPRPPTAVQISISIELAGDISLGLMIPTCGTYSAPAMPQITAESVQMNKIGRASCRERV